MDQYGKILSFYSLKDEYALLKKMVNEGMSLLGSDQIVMYDDRLLFDDLARTTKNEKAKEIYQHVSERSKIQFEKFLSDPGNNPMYMMLSDFSDQLLKLKELKLTPREQDIISKLEISKDIYTTQSHKKRVQLIKHHLMNDFEKWNGKRNLFKYGANHMARGESFLTVTDIGNIMANVAEASYQESFHLMILGESGMQATAFETFPAQPINPDGFYLKHLKPFFELTNDQQWAVFDLVPIRKQLENGKLKIEDENLIRTIKGFDVLILVPEVSAARF